MTSPDLTRTTDAAAVFEELFVFAYPLVLAELTRIAMTSVTAPEPRTMRAPANQLVHARRAAASARAGALRSSAWLDLAHEPVVLSVPDTHGRYYVLSMIDMWTNAFASVGARTTGTGAGAYAIGLAGAQRHALPPGVRPIPAPTRYVRIAGHTCVDPGERDSDTWAVQRLYRLEPLSRWPDGRHAPASAGGERRDDTAPPAEALDEMDARTFFGLAGRLLADNPARPEDRHLIERARRVGLFTGSDDGWTGGEPAQLVAAERGMRRARALVRAHAGSAMGELRGRWRIEYRRGHFGTDYLRRAAASRAPLGVTIPADALPAITRTDGEGRDLSGHHRYVLRFPPDAPPPVDGFWTLSARDSWGSIDRSSGSLGDRDGLSVDADGSLPIHIQHERPVRARQSNWLPVPAGGFELELRLHWPRQEVLARRWSPPTVRRLD